jgi:hypothetical protein
MHTPLLARYADDGSMMATSLLTLYGGDGVVMPAPLYARYTDNLTADLKETSNQLKKEQDETRSIDEMKTHLRFGSAGGGLRCGFRGCARSGDSTRHRQHARHLLGMNRVGRAVSSRYRSW